ncbi:MAG: DNA translocase FtsK [Chloroflexi bacterium]|nr:DNA translocase FtsK [Chloroflexota bacterium]
MSLTPKVSRKVIATPIIGVDEEGVTLFLRLPSPNVGHVLICGTTGSGKTELARAMITSLAIHSRLAEAQLILIDPKRRGYTPFAGGQGYASLPHLLLPVIHDEDEALGALAWLVEEMERRDEEGCSAPRLIVFIDELADLMLASQADPSTSSGHRLEHVLTRLTQRGREAGIYIVACTQKPTAAVIGSLIKSNFPVRIVGSVPDASDAAVATGISGTGAAAGPRRLSGRSQGPRDPHAGGLHLRGGDRRGDQQAGSRERMDRSGEGYLAQVEDHPASRAVETTGAASGRANKGGLPGRGVTAATGEEVLRVHRRLSVSSGEESP